MIDRIKAFWKEITGPDPEELEIRRLEKEREILWRAVDQLTEENRKLREDLVAMVEAMTIARNRLSFLRTDIERDALAYHKRIKAFAVDFDVSLIDSGNSMMKGIRSRWRTAEDKTKD